MHETTGSLFTSDLMPVPGLDYKPPRFELDTSGRPSWVITDEMGCEHTFTDGATIRDARFVGYNLAGVLIRNVVIDTVAFVASRLTNFEVQEAQIRRLNVSGGEGGLVVKCCSVSDVKVEHVNDPEAVVRFFDCEIEGLLVTECNVGIDVARSEVMGLALQRCNFAGRSVAIRESTMRAPRIICCTFTAARLYRVNFFGGELAKCEFTSCHWEDVDVSFSRIAEVMLAKCRVHGLRLDAVTIRTLKLFDTRAFEVTSQFGDLVDIEVVRGVLGMRLDRVQARGLMLWKVGTRLMMNDSKAFGLRICDVIGTVGGTRTTWWAPVIRRSILRGDGTRDITLIDADCTNTQVTNDFGVWTAEPHVRKGPHK